MTSNMEKDINYSKMDAHTQVNMSTAHLKVQEDMIGPMDSIMKESGSLGSDMAQECGMEQKETVMQDNGNVVKQMVLVCISG